ncbi:7-carboxy-7-deazaguanine synthase QueE [Bacillus shivajii]|uniref:7-carboxy-7-deazaguanine synthase QueE n=1 Tax=Bacillus shivajii TaxID=1983719 RepID=UPI001CFA47B9|nr:7-carboxy-7-deazaguanine synthase QueE [Bacillus shivajii]UCZ53954.1 7-carboxy-7-deazaguanine synthase QueE [Bacillus shivajii]
MSKIPVLEIFGPTIQGEGMVVGQKTMFVRTAGCDYSCSWCDSAFTWDGSAKDDIVQMTAEDILKRLVEVGGKTFSHVTISGGNPALIRGMNELVELLHKNSIQVALETQGSRWQEWFLEIDDLTLSPKPPSSNMSVDMEILDDIVGRLTKGNRQRFVSLKVVIFDERDYEFAKMIGARYPDLPLYLQVGNDDVETLDDRQLRDELLRKYEWLIDLTMEDEQLTNVRVLPQLHTLLWGNKRGV